MFGVCYYPEHWPESDWPEDARMMAELGLSYVRIAEFAWSRLEPSEGDMQFDWLDRAINTLAGAGLKVILCTPTATPPKWLIDKYPEILPVDIHTGRTRGFGSRRHYDFSSEDYLRESLRISQQLADRYGSNELVVGWQTDNELCCHFTAPSASSSARAGFQRWCAERYGSIERLNSEWGNVFWSMEYSAFSDIELPFAAVTETNPAHQLAFSRYSSDKAVHYHSRMVEVLRRHTSNQFITHNFIPTSDSDVDDYALAEPLDFASYDNYPLGRTDGLMSSANAEELSKYMRTGHPDQATYDHDQTRCLRGDKFWIMEQQPGPVNWAENNARPAAGMVRFWTLQAMAHGAECVSYFRWRQVPFAQEQMHAGLLRVDRSKTEAWDQIEQVGKELSITGLLNEPSPKAKVAIISNADAAWVSNIECQGVAYEYEKVQFAFYSALRRLGVNVDFVSVNADISNYSIVIAPSLPIIDDAFVKKCEASSGILIFGPRAGAKTSEFCVPPQLAPGLLQGFMPLRVLSVETLRDDCNELLEWQGKQYTSRVWREEISAPGADLVATYGDGSAAIVRYANAIYMATITDDVFLMDFLRQQCLQANVPVYEFGEDIRVQRRGDLLFAFNYSAGAQVLPVAESTVFLLGSPELAGHDVAVWREQAT
ncbi:MAG: beta-galactosidase [Pseudomonadales bacterium]